MISYQSMDGLWCPMILCDACGQQINDPERAIVCWNDQGEIKFAHRGAKCGRKFTFRNGYLYWESFEVFWHNLKHNTHCKDRLSEAGRAAIEIDRCLR